MKQNYSLRRHPRKKSKTNPSGKCFSCNITIFNKSRNAKYCDDCFKAMRNFISNYAGYLCKLKRKFPDYKFSVSVKIKKNK